MIVQPRRAVGRKSERRLRLEFSGNLIKHLGLLMYGGPVPALAELIANAWDADAKLVELTLPLGRPILPADTITIKDYGRGMTWEEVAERYLVIGRNRRSDQAEKTRLGRHVMGRKGIGKLAGFGIARVVELRTVRNKWLTHFAMDFADMTSDSAAHARYEPEILADEPVNEPNSTTVILRHLSIKRAIPAETFKDSLARRFAIFAADFVVKINGKPISKTEMPTLFRVPKSSGELLTDIVPGFGPVQYWFGFTRHPIPEADARGLSIMVRGRMARPPSMFDISGGVWNQQDLEYLTGEVFADGLDDSEDFVSTDRQSINWTEDGPAALRQWGQKLIKDAVREYDRYKSAMRRHENLALIDPIEVKNIDERLAALPSGIRTKADRLLNLFSNSHQDKSGSTFAQVAKSVVQLSEDAVGGTAHEGSALLYSLVQARREIISNARSASNSRLYAILRNHPWLLVSPWRIVLDDPKTTAIIARLRKTRSALSEMKIWAVQYESRRLIAAFGPDGIRIRSQLLALSQELAEISGPRKSTSILHITFEQHPGRTTGIKSVDANQMIAQAEASCDLLSELLEQ